MLGSSHSLFLSSLTFSRLLSNSLTLSFSFDSVARVKFDSNLNRKYKTGKLVNGGDKFGIVRVEKRNFQSFALIEN
jgi:hypothetical protein